MNRSIMLRVILMILISRADPLIAFSPSRRPFFLTQSNQGKSFHRMNVNMNIASSSKDLVCLWKKPGGWWEQRTNINDLQVGQNMTGIVFQELLNGKTGPKGTISGTQSSSSSSMTTNDATGDTAMPRWNEFSLFTNPLFLVFIDCGIGRVDSKGKWQIVTGMLRLGGTGMKESVIQKKVAKLKKKTAGVQVFVRKIYNMSSRVEVVTDETALSTPIEAKMSVSALKKNQEIVGTVVRLENFGAIIDVGANRHGLLHIQKVANLYGRYIDKVKGLEDAGLERGARIRLEVAELDKRRLFLDFTYDVRKDAANEQQQKAEVDQQQKEARMKALADRQSGLVPDIVEVQNTVQKDKQPTSAISNDEATTWAAYSGSVDNGDNSQEVDDDEEYYDDDDEDDEDSAIEDALGLGSW
jgi:predicted RNA-binding protein with RPS1 domain